MARAAGARTDRPPCWGSTVVEGSRRRRPGPASVMRYLARRFRCRFVPAGLALRRHGRIHRGVPKPARRTQHARFGSIARGPGRLAHAAVMAATMAKSSGPVESTSAAVRSGASASASRRFCLDRGRSGQAGPPTTMLGRVSRGSASRGFHAATAACLPRGFQNASTGRPRPVSAEAHRWQIPKYHPFAGIL
jgi:hypothetical protein